MVVLKLTREVNNSPKKISSSDVDDDKDRKRKIERKKKYQDKGC